MKRGEREIEAQVETATPGGLDQVVDGLAAAMARGFVEGLERSGTVRELLGLVDFLRQRVAELEAQVAQNRTPATPEDDRTPRAATDGVQMPSAPAPAPAPAAPAPAAPAPAAPAPAAPAAEARSPASSAVPSGAGDAPRPRPVNVPLGPLPGSRPRIKPRSRTQVRPTVVYRTDPRAQASGEGKAGGAVCLEPGCTRPVHYRGYCLVHVEKVKSTDRPDAAPLGPSTIPLPPLKRPAGGRGKKDGGTKGVFAMLYEERGRRILAGFINQMKFDRRDLVQRLNVQFAGMPGVPLEEEDVMVALHYHQIGDALRKRESEILSRHLTKQRGSLSKTAQAMKLEPEQLRARVADLHMEDEVARVRNRFREEIMERSAFPQRLDLALTREKYLADLGILAEVDDSLRREVRAALERLPAGIGQEERGRLIREGLNLGEQAYRRMVRRYDLGAELPVPPEEPAAKAAEG